jgi:non-specific serine/threonine protein kinase/serine/threonine-protein kinase
METQRWKQIDHIMQQALDLAPQEREAFLVEACAGDEELRREIDALLTMDEEASGFLSEPVLRRKADGGPQATGQRIGSYQIVRELGRGGMGAVYLAERADQQFAQRVAIKLIKRGMDTEEIVSRFRYERQILASLNHPNIARLLDGGATEAGLPYFVMEYVEGAPLIEYSDHRKLDTTGRLKLFLQVCAAIQHAHNNLVIHRDIKPSNILITGNGEVKLLDFGIAKLLNTEEAGLSSLLGRRPMTPEYASPEQARGQNLTTASDVYALGVVLYELLTGHRPYRLPSRAPEEVARVICEQEPEKPSSVIDRVLEENSPDGAPQVARTPESVSAPREGQPEKLRRRLNGDLDNIILTALRKEPERRYQSPAQLAEDIERSLDGRVVTARSNTFGYRSGKFIRRNKAGVAASALVMTALLVGIGGATWQARVARAAQAKSEQQSDDLRKLATSFLFDFHDAIQDLQGSTKARQLVVSKGVEYLDKLAKDAGDNLSLQRDAAAGWLRLAAIQGTAYGQQASLGDSAGEMASYRKALAILESLTASHPDDKAARGNLAETHLAMGIKLLDAGDESGAFEHARKGLEIRKALAAAEPENAPARYNLAITHRQFWLVAANTGHFTLSLDSLRQSVIIAEKLAADRQENPQYRYYYALALRDLGTQLWYRGGLAEALECHGKSRRIFESEFAADPGSVLWRRGVYLISSSVADLLIQTGRQAEALEVSQRAVALMQEAVIKDPANIQARRDLATILERVSIALAAAGRLKEAVNHRRRIVTIQEELALADKANTRYQRDLSEHYYKMSELLDETGETKQALSFARKSQKIFDVMIAREPKALHVRRETARNLILLAKLLAKTGQKDEARRHTTRALEIQKVIADWSETVGLYINEYAWPLLTCEPADLRDPAAALRYAKLAAERTLENDPNILKTLARAYHLTGDHARAAETARKALSLLPPSNGRQNQSILRRDLEAQLAKAQAKLQSQSSR